MDGKNGRPQGEPSFSDTGMEDIGDAAVSTPVDLDRLLEEIDRSVAGASSTHTGGASESWVHALTDVPDLDEADDEPPSPEQSALDFGESERPYAEARRAPLTDTSTSKLNGEELMSRGVLMAGGALLALSLLSGVVGLFVAFTATGKIEALQQSVDSLQSKLATLQVSGDPRVGQLQAEQSGVTSRLDEVAVRLDGLGATLASASEAQLAELRKRLDALERKAAQGMKASTTKSATASPSKTSISKPAASGGDWSVILVSFPSSAQAESEKARLQKLGFRAEVIKSVIDSKSWYRVCVPGYGSHDSAKAAIPGIETKSGIKGAWVAQR